MVGHVEDISNVLMFYLVISGKRVFYGTGRRILSFSAGVSHDWTKERERQRHTEIKIALQNVKIET